jgi:GxxExxY protein
MNDEELNLLTRKIIGFSIDIHTALGPGLLESAYKTCLFYKISESGLYVEKEKPIPLYYKGVRLDCGYRIDLLINDQLVIEVKSVESLTNLHMAQAITYLKLGNYKLGLLMNFNVLKMKEGIKRVILSEPFNKQFFTNPDV